MKLVELTVNDLEAFRERADVLERLEGKGVSVISISKREVKEDTLDGFCKLTKIVYDIFYWEIPLAQMAMMGQ